jgi:hypothetical protein
VPFLVLPSGKVSWRPAQQTNAFPTEGPAGATDEGMGVRGQVLVLCRCVAVPVGQVVVLVDSPSQLVNEGVDGHAG